MKIIVCIKQVPDTTEVKIDPQTNTLIRKGVPSIVNPYDKNALETALQLREKHSGKVTVLTMGPPQAAEALRECLAMGADEAFLISDRAFGGADTLATSYTLAQAIQRLGVFDLIICGMQAIDGDTAQVGPEIAEHLGIAQVTYVSKIKKLGNKLEVRRDQEFFYEVIEAELPLLITVVKTSNEPRLPTCRGIMKSLGTEIPLLGLKDIAVDERKIGLQGSPTQVRKIFSPPQRTQCIKIKKHTAQDAVTELFQKLSDAKII
ncbi:MAG: electron transfer flavoprotein subunit beta/FixA family protein [Peptococcaceae bacterium]